MYFNGTSKIKISVGTIQSNLIYNCCLGFITYNNVNTYNIKALIYICCLLTEYLISKADSKSRDQNGSSRKGHDLHHLAKLFAIAKSLDNEKNVKKGSFHEPLL